MELKGRLEQILTLIDRAESQGMSAQSDAYFDYRGTTIRSVIEIKGKKYILSLAEMAEGE